MVCVIRIFPIHSYSSQQEHESIHGRILEYVYGCAYLCAQASSPSLLGSTLLHTLTVWCMWYRIIIPGREAPGTLFSRSRSTSSRVARVESIQQIRRIHIHFRSPTWWMYVRITIQLLLLPPPHSSPAGCCYPTASSRQLEGKRRHRLYKDRTLRILRAEEDGWE